MHHEISATLEVPLIHTECTYVTPWLIYLLCLHMNILNYMSNTRVIHLGFCCYLLLVTCSIPCWKRWGYLFCESIDYCEEISDASLDFKILWLGRESRTTTSLDFQQSMNSFLGDFDGKGEQISSLFSLEPCDMVSWSSPEPLDLRSRRFWIKT